MSQLQVLKELCREEKEIEIRNVCKLCLKCEISTSTWNRKMNWLFKENAQLRKDDLRLKQTWTSEIGNKEIRMLKFMTPIENSNLKDWNFIRRGNGQIRLKEKSLIYTENWK